MQANPRLQIRVMKLPCLLLCSTVSLARVRNHGRILLGVPSESCVPEDCRRNCECSLLYQEKSEEESVSILSVFVNPKNSDAVELRQLRDEHSEQGNGVDHKMDSVVFRVEAG